MGRLHLKNYDLFDVADQGGWVALGRLVEADVEAYQVTVAVERCWPADAQEVEPGRTGAFELKRPVEWTDAGRSPIDTQLVGAAYSSDFSPGDGLFLVRHHSIELLPVTPASERAVALAFDAKARDRYASKTPALTLHQDLLGGFLTELAWAALERRGGLDARLVLEAFTLEELGSLLRFLERYEAPARAHFFEAAARLLLAHQQPDAKHLAVCERLPGLFQEWNGGALKGVWAAAAQLFARLPTRGKPALDCLHSAKFHLHYLEKNEELQLDLSPWAPVLLSFFEAGESYYEDEHVTWLALVGRLPVRARAGFLEALAARLATVPDASQEGDRNYNRDLFGLAAESVEKQPGRELVATLAALAQVLAADPGPPPDFSFVGTGRPRPSADERLIRAAAAMQNACPRESAAAVEAARVAARVQCLSKQGKAARSQLRVQR